MEIRKNKNIVIVVLLNGMMMMGRITDYYESSGTIVLKDPRMLVVMEKMANGMTKFSAIEVQLSGAEPLHIKNYNYWGYLDLTKFAEIGDMYCQATGSIIMPNKQPFNMN